ncbi:MAG: tRNA (N6-threonylcarbamoyladenosine(37)-N6)-methyltransferase TrmO [Synergistetes bacterium]|nr:tRNA (N6-threonylcarbamoyladenosine(37)-N6)-methyltransferase TrmO [Synergistota bacterium]
MRILFFDLSGGARKEAIFHSLVEMGFPLEKLNAAIRPVGFLPVEAESLLVPKDDREAHRHFSDVLGLVSRMILPVDVRDKVAGTYRLLAEAEAYVHGESIDSVHFHEVGSNWAITMVVGICYGIYYLKVDRVFFSSINVGSGKVMTSHGLLDVPAPATKRLLEGLLWYKSDVKRELATPSSVAVLKAVGEQIDRHKVAYLFEVEGQEGESVEVVRIEGNYGVKPIGIIRTPYKDAAPYQPVEYEDAEFKIELYPEYKEALRGLETFKYIIVLFWLDRARYKSNIAHPPWITDEVGLFASRSPNRPTKIGLSIVKLLAIKGTTLVISPMDAFDGTEVVDIKPYVASLDAKEDANDGWAEGNKHLELHRKGIPHSHDF